MRENNQDLEPIFIIELLTALFVAGSRNAMFFGSLMRSLISFIAGARVLEGLYINNMIEQNRIKILR